MDPIAHTLLGATLAESGLKRHSRYATATLLIGANLPDVDVIAQFWGRDAELFFRRGVTHGVVALVVLPLLLAAGITAWNRWREQRNVESRGAPFSPRAIVVLSFLATWSHPALDWLNTYGVRLLMPFDGRWFYGDTLFIVDPWVWLMSAAGVVLVRSRSLTSKGLWLVVASAATWLVVTTDVVGWGVKAGWLVGVAGLVALRLRQPAWAAAGALARGGLAVLVLYVGSAYGLARLAETAIADRFPGARQIQANPTPGVASRHRVIVVHDHLYRIVMPDGTVHELPRQPPDAIVKTAMAAPAVRGFTNWMRFPYWEVEEKPDRWIVRFWDLRYQGPGTANPRGIGSAQVEVPKDGRIGP